MVSETNFLKEFYLQPVLEKKLLYKFETITMDALNKKKRNKRACVRDVTITYLGKIKDLFVFNIFTQKVTFFREQFKIDERLLSKKFYAFDSVYAGVNENGEIVKIINLKAMQDRWSKTKHELRKDYIGHEFEGFLDDITQVIEDEVKVVQFLKSKNMFGMYFHGLFGKNDIHKIPIKRKEKITGFHNTEITEEIRTDISIPEFIISVQKSDAHLEKIISTTDEIDKYEGSFFYNKESKFLRSFLNIESNSKKIIYSVVWVG